MACFESAVETNTDSGLLYERLSHNEVYVCAHMNVLVSYKERHKGYFYKELYEDCFTDKEDRIRRHLMILFHE